MSRARALTDITLVLQQNTQSPPPETARANGLLSEVIPLHVSYNTAEPRKGGLQVLQWAGPRCMYLHCVRRNLMIVWCVQVST